MPSAERERVCLIHFAGIKPYDQDLVQPRAVADDRSLGVLWPGVQRRFAELHVIGRDDFRRRVRLRRQQEDRLSSAGRYCRADLLVPQRTSPPSETLRWRASSKEASVAFASDTAFVFSSSAMSLDLSRYTSALDGRSHKPASGRRGYAQSCYTSRRLSAAFHRCLSPRSRCPWLSPLSAEQEK